MAAPQSAPVQSHAVKQPAVIGYPNEKGVTIERVTYPARNIGTTIVANLFKPAGFDASRKYAAVVVTHPFGGVKEQTAGLYAQRLAEHGLITVAYDASYQGESGGEPRLMEVPAQRLDDISCAIDFLTQHPQVDPERIGSLGICAGGGYALCHAQTELRVKAVAAVSTFNLGEARREGMGTATLPRRPRLLPHVARSASELAEPVRVLQSAPADGVLSIRAARHDRAPTLAGHRRVQSGHALLEPGSPQEGEEANGAVRGGRSDAHRFVRQAAVRDAGGREAGGLLLPALDRIADLLNHPALAGFARLTLPWDDRDYEETMPLRNIGALLPYHTHVDPDTVVSSLNRMIDDASVGRTVFYDIYGNDRAIAVSEGRMNLFTAMLTTMALLASIPTQGQTLVITRGGSRPMRQAPAENFTGGVRVEMLFEAVDPSHASGGSVTFEAGARTAWHSHPRGQILIVTAGAGRVQRWGDPVEEIRAGDVVRIPAGQKHWHGASPHASMTHIAISEHRDGTTVQWMEKVSDEQYNAVAPGPQAQSSNPQQGATRVSGALQQRIAPGLATLTDDVLFGDVWRRPELSPRDRSLVTVSILIATGKSAQLAGHLGRALDNGVQPGETSGLLAHLAIYCGWPSAVSALEVYEQVYTARKVDTGALAALGPRLPAAGSDAARAKTVTEELGAIAPKFAQLTNDVVFDDLWRRADLSVRDRNLVTIAALAAMGDDDQLDLYLRRGVDSGLTRAQIVEALTHLSFYAGWAKATKAITALTRTLGK